MIELGAYWGHYSMWLKKARPKAEVVLVEPDPACLKTGQDNFARNGLRAEFVKAFVGKGKFEVDAVLQGQEDQASRHIACRYPGLRGRDAAGRGERARPSAASIISSSQPIRRPCHQEVVDRLKAHGYRVEISSDFEEQSTSFDGFVFASSPEVDALFGEIEVMGRREIALRQPADVLRSLNGLLEAGEARAANGTNEGTSEAMNAPAAPHKLLKGATGDWEIVIGLEVHAQVTSNAKLFSGASTAFGGEPNSHVSLVDAAMPGMLPVINAECVRQAVRTGLGLNAQINLRSVFDRKNYFYPDLPQGYQISQYKSPIVGEGEVVVELRRRQDRHDRHRAAASGAGRRQVAARPVADHVLCRPQPLPAWR